MGTAGNNFTASGILNDFFHFRKPEIPGFGIAALICLWGGGTVILHSSYSDFRNPCKSFKKDSASCSGRCAGHLYADCIRQLGIGGTFPCVSPPRLHSPVTAGIAAPCVLLPGFPALRSIRKRDTLYSAPRALHYKHKDLICGALFPYSPDFYWFHPMVWLALKEMVSDREIACDTAVLALLGKKCLRRLRNCPASFCGAPLPSDLWADSRHRRKQKRDTQTDFIHCLPTAGNPAANG